MGVAPGYGFRQVLTTLRLVVLVLGFDAVTEAHTLREQNREYHELSRQTRATALHRGRRLHRPGRLGRALPTQQQNRLDYGT